MLEIVREPDNPTNANAVRNFIATAAMYASVIQQPKDEELRSIYFNQSLDAEAVISLLSRPIADFVPYFNDVNVKRSVRSSAMPKSRIFQDTFMFGQEAVENLKSMQQDLFGLADVMAGPIVTEAVTMDVYTEDEVNLIARESLLNKSLKELRDLSALLGMAPDEINLMRSINRQKEKLGQMRMYHLDEAGIDSELLRQAVINNEYYRKMVRDGEELSVVLLAHGQSPGKDEITTSRVELGKVISAEIVIEDDHTEIPMGQRRQVTFYRKDKINHVAIPVISWRQRTSKIVSSLPELDFSRHKTEYDESTHTVYHYSPLLGSVMLANCIDNSIFEGSLFKLFRNNPHNLRTHLPDRAIGALPALISIPSIKNQVGLSPLFRQLRQSVK
jgi:hypothetical protein